MKYLRHFNERLGIATYIEEQSDYIIYMIQSDTKTKYNFIYYDDVKNTKVPFTLIIKDTLDVKGSYQSGSGGNIIYLKNRADKSTLLHEMKHMDFHLKKKNCFDDLFHKAEVALNVGLMTPSTRSEKRIKLATQIFYVYNNNEFESKYHSYYKQFDAYLSKISGKLESSDIVEHYNKFLNESTDKSWWWYYYPNEFTFDTFLPESDINQMFFFYLNDGNKVSFTDNMFNNMYQIIKYDMKKFYKTKFNSYTATEKAKIAQLKRFFEKDIDRKVVRYRKKMSRIVTLMVEKYT